MALQFSTAYRNALLDQFESTVGVSAKIKIFTGAAPANCAASDAGSLLVEFDLASDWMDDAAAGAKALSSVPVSATAAAGGTAAHFRILSSGGACHAQGSITATGGAGDMTLDNTSIASGQTVAITGLTLTAPGA